MIVKYQPRGYGKCLFLKLTEKELLDLIKSKADEITISNSIPFIENTIKEIEYLLGILKGTSE